MVNRMEKTILPMIVILSLMNSLIYSQANQKFKEVGLEIINLIGQEWFDFTYKAANEYVRTNKINQIIFADLPN